MKTAPRERYARPTSVRLFHPGSRLCRQWRPGPPVNPFFPQLSRQTQMGWSTPCLSSEKSKPKSHLHNSNSTGNRHVIHTEVSAGLTWCMERRKLDPLLETATAANTHKGHTVMNYTEDSENSQAPSPLFTIRVHLNVVVMNGCDFNVKKTKKKTQNPQNRSNLQQIRFCIYSNWKIL